MHLHSALAACTLWGSLGWASPPTTEAQAKTPKTSELPLATPDCALPCVADGSCKITRAQEISTCSGKSIVETMLAGNEDSQSSSHDCPLRSHWLCPSGSSAPVFLFEDCTTQIGAATLGTATMETKKCDIVVRYVEHLWDTECRVRIVGVHLDTLQLFGETERSGVDHGGNCKTGTAVPIQLPRGKGTTDSPLVELDGPTVKDLRSHGRAASARLRTPDGRREKRDGNARKTKPTSRGRHRVQATGQDSTGN
jgi:hypothetical protein